MWRAIDEHHTNKTFESSHQDNISETTSKQHQKSYTWNRYFKLKSCNTNKLGHVAQTSRTHKWTAISTNERHTEQSTWPSTTPLPTNHQPKMHMTQPHRQQARWHHWNMNDNLENQSLKWICPKSKSIQPTINNAESLKYYHWYKVIKFVWKKKKRNIPHGKKCGSQWKRTLNQQTKHQK